MTCPIAPVRSPKSTATVSVFLDALNAIVLTLITDLDAELRMSALRGKADIADPFADVC